MTQEIALLMGCSAACAFGHLLPGPYLYLRLTLMRTFLLPSPDYRVVMTHTGRQAGWVKADDPGQSFWRYRGWILRLGAFRARMNLPIMEKKGYIAAMTVSIQTLQRSSSLLRNNKGREEVIK